MSDDHRRISAERLPIKLILPEQGRERAVVGGGPAPRPFRQVDDDFRKGLRNQVDAIRALAEEQKRRVGCVPIRARLVTKAVAKSHRPENLFSESTCPIIGAGRLGELYLKATPSGLTRLAHVISTNRSESMIKAISSIELIEPVTPAARTNNRSAIDVLRQSPRGERGFITRVRLFNFGQADQSRVVADFLAVCKQREIGLDQGAYTPSSYTYAAECRSEDDVTDLARVVGVRSVSPMPIVKSWRPMMLSPTPAPPDLLNSRDVEGEYPAVVVVDSGVSGEIPALASWIVGRESAVPPEYRNPRHGTFVAGLVCLGGQMNPHLPDVDRMPCGVFDLQLIPNYDPAVGDTDEVTESAFLQTLESSLRVHSNRFKVWNLSIGTNEICSLDEFSPLAEQLDNLQEKYQVSFVISAGNYEKPPLLDYPRSQVQSAAGRITAPADSVLGIAVGSICHVAYGKEGRGRPSAFSRNGAGPNYIIKPDLVHYGGTCSTDLTRRDGIRSISGTGCGEDLGTSFAAPLVSRTLAQIYHQITPTPSPVLARALLTHGARDPRTHGRVPDGEENYLGFGRPATTPTCLECTPYSSTLVFEDSLRPGFYLEWDDFPYPPALRRGGRYYGEIWMTIAFAPARGARWGSEYCETHIDASFGVYFTSTSRGGQVSERFRGLVPPEHKNKGELYETFQVQELRKWAPVRTYHGLLGKRGERGNRWRLMVRLLSRHGIDKEMPKSQPFALVLTISDPDRKVPVYDQMAQIVHNKYQAQNLSLRAVARVRTRA
jgi:serine protease AprX